MQTVEFTVNQLNVGNSGAGPSYRLASRPRDVPAAIMNRDVALARMGGDAALFSDLAELFLADAPLLLQEARSALTLRDAVSLHRAAHSLKGLAANFEGLAAVMAASQLSEFARLGQLQACESALGSLDREIHQLMDALQQVLDN